MGSASKLPTPAASLVGYLSDGKQQMFAFARGLMARPKMILMNVTSMGLSQARAPVDGKVGRQAGGRQPSISFERSWHEPDLPGSRSNGANDPTWTCPVGQISDL